MCAVVDSPILTLWRSIDLMGAFGVYLNSSDIGIGKRETLAGDRLDYTYRIAVNVANDLLVFLVIGVDFGHNGPVVEPDKTLVKGSGD